MRFRFVLPALAVLAAAPVAVFGGTSHESTAAVPTAGTATTPTTPRPAATTVAPWHVVADLSVGANPQNPAYVSAASGRPLLVTVPISPGLSADDPYHDVIARTTFTGTGATGVLPRAVVGVVRAPGAIDRVITVQASLNGARDLRVSTLSPAKLTLDGGVSIPATLPAIGTVKFAQSSSGDCVLAWSEARIGTGDDPVTDDVERIRVATGKWGVFGSPQTIREIRGTESGPNIEIPALAVAVNAAGMAVVASDAGPKIGVSAWIGSARTGRFVAPLTTNYQRLVGPLQAAVAADGRTVLAWRISNGDAMDPHTPVTMYAATVAPGGRKISPPQVVDRGPVDYPSSSGLSLVAAPGRGATLAFTGEHGSHHTQIAFVADLDRSGRFKKPVALVRDGTVGGLAVRSDGTQVVTLIGVTRNDGPRSLTSRLRAPGARSFAPAEAIAAVGFDGGGNGRPVPDAPVPTFDVSTGQPVIAWATRGPAGTKTADVVVVARDRP